jgi:hypothetical protein
MRPGSQNITGRRVRHPLRDGICASLAELEGCVKLADHPLGYVTRIPERHSFRDGRMQLCRRLAFTL